MTDYKFKGWIAYDKETGIGGMKWQEFEPKTFGETDVDIKITHCGICGTDLHTLSSGWFPTDYPTCVGHELVGKITRVGAKVSEFQVGQIAGVGAQVGSCADCDECASGLENYCSKLIPTYNGRFPNGERCMGGYANYWRGPAAFVFLIPEGMSPAEAAPMLCAGVSVYFPLKTHGCGPGKKVGIIGIGGLGHFGLLFAKALGADKVVAISRYNSGTKRQDALSLGADEYIATEDEPDWATKHARSLDLIISTVSSPKMPLLSYLSLLRVHGTLIQVGAPEDMLPPLNAHWLIGKGVKLAGSLIGPPSIIREMLQVAVAKNVRPLVQERRMADANAAVLDMDKGLARFRYVLVNDDDDDEEAEQEAGRGDKEAKL